MKHTRLREKLYPIRFDQRLTKEQDRRIKLLAQLWHTTRPNAIRRCIDETFVKTLQPNSSDSTMQSNEFGK